MAWNPNIPAATDQLSQSQLDIQGNFQALNPIFNGINNFLLFPVQGSGPTTSATQVALYSKAGITTNQELFFRRTSSGTEIDCTGSAQTSNGWSRLPSGILIKWGTAAVASRDSLTTITFPTGGTIPAFSSIFSVTANPTFSAGPTVGDLNIALLVGNFTTTTFQAFGRAIGSPSTTPAFNITYYAIGV